MSGDIELPKGWAQAKLEALVEIRDNSRIPVNAEERATRRGPIPYYGATGQVGWIDDFIFDEELVLLGEDGAPFLEPDRPKAYVIHGKSWVNNHVHVLRALGETPSSLWKYQLDQVDYHPFVSGTTRLKLPQAPMRQIPLVVPPLKEQWRIVASIDSYVTRLDDAVATLERAQRNLKRLQASVLKAAVEGRLVPTEAELARAEKRDYEPASELLKRILVERRRRWEETELAKMKASGKTPKDDKWKAKYEEPAAPDATKLPDLPKGWCWSTVDQLTAGDRSCGYGVLIPGPDVTDGIPLVRVGDVRGGRVVLEALKKIAKEVADQFQRTYLRGGEILISLVGTIGRTAVVPDVLAGANVARAIGVFPVTSKVKAHWLEHWFRSPSTQAEMIGKAHEVARKTLNLEDFRAAAVALPPVEEQTRVIEAVADLESIIDAASVTVENSFLRCATIRRSILKWAFEGKLADQDPNDEPASVLLERIRAERAAAPEKKTAPRRARQSSRSA